MKTAQRNRHQPPLLRKASPLVRLNVPLSIKAETINAAERTFEGLAATWKEDLGQDVIHKGAFKASIMEWKSSGEAMPLLNSHDHFDIFSVLGQALSMKETSDGLWAKWEVLDGEDGDRVLQRIRPSPRTGRALIGKMSIGFVPIKFNFEQPPGTESFWDRIRHITEAALKEVSLVLFPMNPGASIDASTVKMWLKAAHDTDPRQLDGVTRMELRRLNSRIGLLLKKQKAEDDDPSDESDDAPDPSTSQSPPQAGTVASSDDEADDAETPDEQDEQEESDTNESDGEEEEAEPVRATPDVPPEPTEQKDEPKPYLFSEALQQRLQKVALQRKISETTK
ncbi:MAG TPA: HK97 family phage prohead protease [Rhodothermales bacterium]